MMKKRTRRSSGGRNRTRHATDVLFLTPLIYRFSQVDLNSVDITTPLGADEVLRVPTHRVVESIPQRVEDDDHRKSKHKKANKKSSEKDRKKSSKSSKSEKVNKSGDNKDLDNLLGLDWNLDSNSNSAVAPSFAPASNSFAASSSAGSSKMEKDKEVAGKDKEKLSGLFWLPLYSDKNIEISYNVQTTSSSSEVTVVFKTLNLSKDGSRLSAAIKLSPSDPSKRFVKALQTK